MSRKIATPAAVFAACDQLNESGKPWNRDDVRIAVGGGGFSVIDPLIKAWRKLTPVKALASSTPTTLLHQVAEALEVHFSQHISDVEHRETERTRIFESAIADISERISSVEIELEQENASNLALTEERSRLSGEIEAHQRNLHEKERTLLKLQTENDELRGLTQRLEKQNGTLVEQYKLDRKALENKQESTIYSMLREHKLALSKEKKELTERNEQAENRLMMLLDQERTDVKKHIKESTKERDQFRKKEADANEQTTKFKIECQVLHDKLDTLRQEKEKLNNSLTKTESRYQTLQDEYQSAQKNDDNVKFEALRSTVLALQESLKTK